MLVAEIHGSQINGTGGLGDKVMGDWREGQEGVTHIVQLLGMPPHNPSPINLKFVRCFEFLCS